MNIYMHSQDTATASFEWCWITQKEEILRATEAAFRFIFTKHA